MDGSTAEDAADNAELCSSDKSVDASNEPSPDEEIKRISCLKSVIDSLKSASNDTQKFTYLLILAKLINQSTDFMTLGLRREIFEAIGPSFLRRLLKTSEPAAGCPPLMYQCIGVTIIRCLCADTSVASSPAMLETIPILVDIVMEGAFGDRDIELTLIKDAYECLVLVAMHPAGAQTLVDAGAVDKIVSIIVEEKFNHEQALQVLLRLVHILKHEVWRKNFLVYLSLVERLSNEFEKDHSKSKAQSCHTMTRLLWAAPPNMIPLKGSTWVMNLQKGVADILGSRVDKKLHDAALHLSAAITITVHPQFWLRSSSPERSSDPRDRFLVLLVRLVVVELQLLLEDTSWQQILAEKELLGSCFAILENVMTAQFSNHLQLLSEEDRTFLYKDASEGTDVVVHFVGTFLNSRVEAINDDKAKLTEEEMQVFTASMRILAARLMEDPDAFGERAVQVLPLICALLVKQDQEAASSLWDILLPVFVSYSADEATRKILIDAGIPVLLFDRFESIRKEFLAKTKTSQTCLHLPAAQEEKEVNPMKLILSLLLNVLVSERDAVRKSGRAYSRFWRPVFETLLELGSVPKYLPLVGHLVVCGLMLTRIFPEFQETMGGVGCRYLSATVRFLWDAFNTEESSDGHTLDVSFSYKPIWDEVKDLWYIGMDCIAKLAENNRTLADFIVLVEWPSDIVRSLAKSNPILPHTATVFETFLLTIAKRSKTAEQAMKDFGPHRFCDNHGMTALKSYLVPFASATPTP